MKNTIAKDDKLEWSRISLRLGRMLYQARQEQNLTLEQLSNLSGFREGALQLMENGDMKIWSNKHLDVIVKLFARLDRRLYVNFMWRPESRE